MGWPHLAKCFTKAETDVYRERRIEHREVVTFLAKTDRQTDMLYEGRAESLFCFVLAHYCHLKQAHSQELERC